MSNRWKKFGKTVLLTTFIGGGAGAVTAGYWRRIAANAAWPSSSMSPLLFVGAGAAAGFACATVGLSLFLLVVGANHDCTLSELPISIVGGGLLASTASYIAVIGINAAMAHPIITGIAAVSTGLACTAILPYLALLTNFLTEKN